MKIAIALVVAFAVGFLCRYFELPVPAPPALPGALIVMATTIGFLVGDAVFGPQKRVESTQVVAPSSKDPESAP